MARGERKGVNNTNFKKDTR